MLDDPYMHAIIRAVRPAFEQSLDGVAHTWDVVPGGARAKLTGTRWGQSVTLQLDRKGHPSRTVSAVCFTLIGGKIRFLGRTTVPCQYVTTDPPAGLVEAITSWIGALPANP